MAEPGFEPWSFSCQSKYYNHSNCAVVLLDYIVTLARLSLVTNKGYLLTYLLTYSDTEADCDRWTTYIMTAGLPVCGLVHALRPK